ncbi:MAG: hypothetical protein ABI968_08800 [Acidobacteriota bacterium]
MPETPSPDPTNELVAALRAPDAPRKLRLFAARGLLPVERDDRLRALLSVLLDEDPEIGAAARETLGRIPLDDIGLFLEDGEPTEGELDVVSRYTEDPFVLERVIRNRLASDETLMHMASIVTGAPQEALIINQVRLLREPLLLDALLANPGLTIDGRRRLSEMREEFFEKEARRKEQERIRLEAEAQRERDEAAGIVFEESEGGEGAAGEAGEAQEGAAAEKDFDAVGLGEVYKRIAMLTVKEKVELAQKGTKEERRILIGDMNRIVSLAVLRCESITNSEIEQICAMRHLQAEIFAEIAGTREWIKKPKIQLALVTNPAVPLNLSLPLVKFIGMRELRNIMRDRNLPEGIRTSARKILLDKRGG